MCIGWTIKCLHIALPRISGISITRYQTTITLDARWSYLNTKTVKLYSVDVTDLRKGITNDTFAFEWGDNTSYWMNKESTCWFSTFSDRVRSKFVSFLTSKDKITISNVLLQSHIRSRDGSVGIVTRLRIELPKNRGSFPPDGAKDLSFPKFSTHLWGPPSPRKVREPLPLEKGTRVWGWSPTSF